jgi:hypothetical protein
MDKHLHKDIGEQFSNEINKLSQQPREHIWENIDKQLDKTEAKNYKDKFTTLRKRTLLLLLLLICISSFSILYFNISKNKKTNLAELQTGKQFINKEGSNSIPNNQIAAATNKFNQLQPNNNISTGTIAKKGQEVLFVSGKLSIKQNGKTNVKIRNGSVEEDENTIVDEIKSSKDDIVQKETKKNISQTDSTFENAEKIVLQNFKAENKDSLSVTSTVPLPKNKKKQNNDFRFTVTAFTAPDYSKYHLTNDKQNNYDNKTNIATRERSDLSFSYGLLLGYKAGNKITIQSGVIYSSSEISIAPTKIYAEKNNIGTIKYRYNTSSGYGYVLPSFSNSPAVGDSLVADGANHSLHYISIPFIVKYKLGNGKLSFNPGAGITFNFLTKATLTTDLVDRLNRETEYISKLEGIKIITPGIIITPEVQYQLSKNFSISATPYLKYSLGPINKDNVVKTFPYTIGLGVGGVFKF